MARRSRRRRVPEVLWRVYGGRARPLDEAILSLVPSPQQSRGACRCCGSGCLGCSATEHLVRRDDPPEYRALLSNAFCVVSSDTLPPPVGFSDVHLPQRLVVRSVMELLMDEPGGHTNVLCNGYDKELRFSFNAEFLCTFAWELLLTRVTGPLLYKFPRNPRLLCDPSILKKQTPVPMLDNVNGYGAYGLKRRRSILDVRPSEDVTSCSKQHIKLSGIGESMYLHGGKIVFGKPKSMTECRTHCDVNYPAVEGKKSLSILQGFEYGHCRQIKSTSHILSHSQEMAEKQSQGELNKDSAVQTNGSDGVGKSLSCGYHSNSKKRRRSYSWQRSRKRQKVMYPGENVLNDLSFVRNDNGSSRMKLHPNLGIKLYHQPELVTPTKCSPITTVHEKEQGAANCNLLPDVQAVNKMASCCFNCLLRRSSVKVATRTQIKRRYIFYAMSSSHSVLPRNHILNRLKANNLGAVSLMNHIFGFSNELLGSCSPCKQGILSCPIGSKCSYHMLLRLLKSLIRNFHHCRYRKLLRKHCPSSTFTKCAKDESRSLAEAVDLELSELQDSSSNGVPSKSNGFSGSEILREDSTEKTHKLSEPDTELGPIELYCEHKQVVSFIWAVIRSIIPPDLLGNSSTWRSLRKNISKFVRLRRFEDFSLKECIQGLRTSNYPFLSNIRLADCFCVGIINYEFTHGKNMKTKKQIRAKSVCQKLLQSWAYWLFSYIVLPMIRANFYVTERESGKQDVFYYVKPVWRKLVDSAITCLKEQTYRAVDRAPFLRIMKKRSFGFSKVRFLPKEKTLRPLANLKAPSQIQLSKQEFASKRFTALIKKKRGIHPNQMNPNGNSRVVRMKAVNSALRELYAILRRIKVEDPEKLGCSVFDYNDVYQRLHKFVLDVRRKSIIMAKVFIVVADVSKAYDSIDQNLLINIMQDVIPNDEYAIKTFAHIVCTKKSMWAFHDQVSVSPSCLMKIGASIRLYKFRGIFIDEGVNKTIAKDKLHHLLGEHLKHSMLQIGQNFFLQKVGICQGSLLSSLLCSFYYGHLERMVILPYLEKGKQVLSDERLSLLNDDNLKASTESNGNDDATSQNYMLLRLIDDFLFISTSEKQAASFFSRMRRGYREYNCSMNSQKFGLNFDTRQSSDIPNRVFTGVDGVSFIPWSGLLLNCHTLEIQADYTRYCGVHMSSTITIRLCGKVDQNMKDKLCDYMRPKCHPILYDSNINSPGTVRLNAYQAFLLCAMKFHCYVRSVPEVANLCPGYLLDVLLRSFRFMYQLMKKRMHDMQLYFNIKPILRLKKAEIIWLGLLAYVRVLKKKQSRYKELLSLLRSEIATYGSIYDSSPHMKYAVEDSHSSLFWKLKF